jgi:hypothetical protein
VLTGPIAYLVFKPLCAPKGPPAHSEATP